MLAVVAVAVTSVIILHDFMLEIRSRLRCEEYTSAYGAGVVVVKPSGDAMRPDEMAARKADLALDDSSF